MISSRDSFSSHVHSTQAQLAASLVVRQMPRDTSTVVPGQLPMVTLDPVSALKRVDLPVFGAPASDTVGASGPAPSPPPAWQQALTDGVGTAWAKTFNVRSDVGW